MNLIYVFTLVLLLVLYILIYKKEEKQNILITLGISIVILLCYNIFICVIMSFIKIPSTLANLTIINIIVVIMMGIKILKSKKIQKYEIKKIDILSILVILIITIIISIKQYGIPLNIKNSVTDATVHYFAASEFYNTSMLLINGNNDIFNFWSLDFFMPGAYINTGILFKIFSRIMNETYFPQLYFLFDISMWCLSGILMYILLSKNVKEEKTKIFPLIFSLIYMLGYPLNSLLSGFSYLSLGLNIIVTLLIVMQENLEKYHKMILMFFLNIGIFFSYYYFVPIVYFSIFLQIITDILKNKDKILKLKNILNILYTLILPGIIGTLFFVIFQFLKRGISPITNTANILAIPGDIYSNLITNVVIFLLLSIYYIINCFKNKNGNLSNKMLETTIIFMLLLFIGMQFKVVSEYYYYKVYYLLWPLVISVGFNGVMQLASKRKWMKITSYIGIGMYCVGVVLAFTVGSKILIFDIYKENSDLINSDLKIVSYQELQLLDYYNVNINKEKDNLDNDTYMCIPRIERGKEIWIYSITKNMHNYIDLTYGELTFDLQQFIDSNKKYCLLLKEDYFGDYDQVEEKIEINKLKILFRNNSGMILEKSCGKTLKM